MKEPLVNRAASLHRKRKIIKMKKEIGEQIKALRKKIGVSTYALQNKGIHPSLPTTIEEGKKGYSIDSLVKYLNAIDEGMFLRVGKE